MILETKCWFCPAQINPDASVGFVHADGSLSYLCDSCVRAMKAVVVMIRGLDEMEVEVELDDELLEKCAVSVHKAYCAEFFKRGTGEYWTKGDYSLLDETTKEIDRATARAVFKVLEEESENAIT